ncbi:hypothetical protein CARUB_v10006861mg [Capsella rubella]|uniref:Uncharacterized protein n=1 Tax=Capsella rubella TaxID=81985 RepID=R0H146_9BRAS|nr:putative cell wall protein [Capsella rubella]EOA18340.1 hypothetical protein CARUB_v10006861mg [Capsella rubella]
MAWIQKTLTATIVLVSLLLGCTDEVNGMRYIPNSPTPSESKHSDFLLNNAPQPYDLIPGFGRFLLPPTPKLPFLPYKDPLAPSPATSYPTPPSRFASSSGYKARSPGSREDQVPPVPQP